MTDLIRRADAIEAIFKVGHEHVEEKVIPLGAVTDYSDAIKALPSAEAEWIPCSERLPGIACRCLVTLSNNIVAVGTLHSEGEYEDDFGYIVNWGKRWHLEPASMMIAYHEDSVIAWMPLPEPYKGGDSE